MNSPPDLDSPSPSTPSSGSPPPEEVNYQAPSGSSYLSNLTSHISTAFGGAAGSSKRRLPTGSSFGAASSARDAKTRKRTAEANRSGAQFDGPGGASLKKEKDELIDNSTVEWLRKEIGDPFQEPGIKG